MSKFHQLVDWFLQPVRLPHARHGWQCRCKQPALQASWGANRCPSGDGAEQKMVQTVAERPVQAPPPGSPCLPAAPAAACWCAAAAPAPGGCGPAQSAPSSAPQPSPWGPCKRVSGAVKWQPWAGTLSSHTVGQREPTTTCNRYAACLGERPQHPALPALTCGSCEPAPWLHAPAHCRCPGWPRRRRLPPPPLLLPRRALGPPLLLPSCWCTSALPRLRSDRRGAPAAAWKSSSRGRA